MEFWIAGANVAGEAANIARQAEREGLDGISFGDTQCIAPDPYVGLTVAASVTTRLKLLVGVTNPVTRDPAITACSIASVQIESQGRAVLGIGRGDSAVSKIGLRAGTVPQFEEYLVRLQGYLSGHIVVRGGKNGSLEWLRSVSLPKVPVDVAATGPAVIAAAARQAERISFNFGADGERIARAMAQAREERARTGRGALSFGIYLPVAPHPDIRAARQMVKGVVGVYTRFQAMPGHPQDQVRPENARVIKAVGENYDNSRHGRADAAHIALLEDDFIDRFAVVGPAERCVDRLRQLIALGLDRIMIVGPNRLAAEHYPESRRLLTEIVIPELRRAAK